MSNLVTEIEGIVSAVSQREDRYGVKIGEDWFGGFGTCPVKKGDSVVVSFWERDGWKNIKGIRLLDPEEESVPRDEELQELHQKIRQRNYEIAEQSIEDAKRLLAASGLRSAVTPQNVVHFAERLTERRIVHATKVIEEYLRRKRLEKKKAAQKTLENEAQIVNPDPSGEWEK